MDQIYKQYLSAQIDNVAINEQSNILLQIPVEFTHLSLFIIDHLYAKNPNSLDFVSYDKQVTVKQIQNFKTQISRTQQLNLLIQNENLLENLIYIKVDTGIFTFAENAIKQPFDYILSIYEELSTLELDISPKFTFKRIKLFCESDAQFLNIPINDLNSLFTSYVETLDQSINPKRDVLIKKFQSLDFVGIKTYLSYDLTSSDSNISGTIFATSPVILCGIQFNDFWASISCSEITNCGASTNADTLTQLFDTNREIRKISKVIMSGKSGFQLDPEALYFLANQNYGIQIVFGIENELASEYLKLNVPIGSSDLKVVGIQKNGKQEIIYQQGEFLGVFQ
ncbi:hypothetical protein SS50377_25640 [Spironucleus salmonicida]|uniref:Uncharacterized protein n=1 Tax=Spironucleus salmonicida TaxID=348837 RepID=V6M7L7_9EUKA|nr:hypothetical protein SS50377_25640 [Spironucleus salmonicida]|eukprot:EST49459.1 hypothetical protein SS50377_10208 [Spironucleus salmonicida]